MTGIYKITNKINGKVYIGQSTNIEKRWQDHKNDWKYNKTKLLYKAFEKYGLDNFTFEVLEECCVEELNSKEIDYIKQFRSYCGWGNNGYNMTLGGEGAKGIILTEERKQHLSKLAKERNWTGENNPNYNNHALAGENHFNYGKHLSNETKNKISQSHKGIHKGGKNTQAKRVCCEGVLFDCIKDCAEYYEVNYSTMKSWLLTRKSLPQEWYDRQLHLEGETMEDYKIQDGKKRGNHNKAKKVFCDNMIFDCGVDCAEYYDIPYGRMKQWLSGKNKMPQDFIDKGLKYYV